MFVSNFALSFHVILAPFVMIKLMWSFRMLFEIYPYHFHYLCVLLFVDPKPTVVAPLLPDCCASEDINFCWFSISRPLTPIVRVGSDRLRVLSHSTWRSCCLTIEVRLSTSLSFASRTNGRRNVVASSIGTTDSKGCGGCSSCSRPYEITQNREANGLDWSMILILNYLN